MFNDFGHVFHNVIPLNCREIGSLDTVLDFPEPLQKPRKRLRGRVPARQAGQKFLKEACELCPTACQRAALGRFDARADHSARNRELALQALAELSFGPPFSMARLKLFGAG